MHPYVLYNVFTSSLYFTNCLYESYTTKHTDIEDHSNNFKGNLTIPNVSGKFRLHELYSK